MTKKVNMNVKSGLAKLMATENITVIHNPKAKTASFDIKNRICTLPMLKNMEDDFVYDAFIAHEIGHALYTPWSEKEYNKLMGEIPMVFLNVTEDARIERMVKEAYPGTVRSFFRFYKKITSKEVDFFGIKDKDIQQLTLLDRINLQFKAGVFYDIKFTQEERKFVDMVASEVTFEDAVTAAKAIYEYMKQKGQKQEDNSSAEGDGEQGPNSENGGQSTKKKKSNSEENSSSEDQRGGQTTDEQGSEDEVENEPNKTPDNNSFPEDTGCTQESLNNSMEGQMMGSSYQSDDNYFGDIVRHDISWKKYVSTIKVPDMVPMDKYGEFIKSISPTVNMMASYFNMKKTASDYYKNSVQKTGQLSPDRLVHYRTSEDIFLRNEIVYDSKNHGMVMFIDWSGSMIGNIHYTVKQLLVLIEFCRKTQIPFEVYGFTDTMSGIGYQGDNKISTKMNVKVFKIISSDMKGLNYKKTAAYIYNCVSTGRPNNISSMSGTPINSVAFLSEYIVNEFKEKFKREKTIVCFLSDGDETDHMVSSSRELSKSQSGGHIVMRDSHTGKCYDHDYSKDGRPWHSIFKYVKEKCEITKLVGFYLGSISSYSSSLVSPNNYKKFSQEDLANKFNNNKYVEFGKDRAFDKYYIVSIANFDINLGDRKINIGPFDTDSKIDKKIGQFLESNTKPLLFLKKFIEEIA